VHPAAAWNSVLAAAVTVVYDGKQASAVSPVRGL